MASESGENKLTGVVLVAAALGALWLYDTGKWGQIAATVTGKQPQPGQPGTGGLTGYSYVPGTAGVAPGPIPTGAFPGGDLFGGNIGTDALVSAQAGALNGQEQYLQQQQNYQLQLASLQQQYAAEQQQLAGMHGSGYGQSTQPGDQAIVNLQQCHGVGDCVGKGLAAFGGAIIGGLGKIFGF